MAGGSTEMNHMMGTSAFKYKPGFFDIPPEDVRSLKFVSNLLGLDDSATVKDLQDYEQKPPDGYYGIGRGRTERREHVGEFDMRGNDPAWITVGSAIFA